MSELDYIGEDELIFNNDNENGIHSGGFSVNSIMMKAGMSPIMTMNSPENIIGGSPYDKVSDLFDNLVVPNWALSYNNRIVGGKYKEYEHDDISDDDEVINDDLYDKLIELVKETDLKKYTAKAAGIKKKQTKRNKNKIVKKKYTRKTK